MTGKGSRDKGAGGERELVKLLTDLGFQGLRRGNVFAGEPDVMGLWPFHIEVKRVEKLNLKKAVEQSISEMRRKKDGIIPVVFHRKNREKWKMTIPEDYVEIVLRALVKYMDHAKELTFPEEWFELVITSVVWYMLEDHKHGER